MSTPGSIAFDDWIVHPASGELESGGARIRLQDQPLQVLVALLRQPGEVVSREALVTLLWPAGVVDFENNLNAVVRKVRQALGDDADAPRYIETIPRKGYRFIGRIAALPAPASSQSSVAEPPRRRTRQLAWVGAAIIVLSAIVALVSIDLTKDTPAPPAAAASLALTAPVPRLRLAILPFRNLSPDPANAFFTAGLHDEILNALANGARNLEVISNTTMRSYRSTSKTASEIAKELAATHVLEGSVRREEHNVRLTVQLIDARNDAHLWSENFDRRLETAMSLQSEVAEAIASKLTDQTHGPVPPSTNPQAYDAYLKARHNPIALFTITSTPLNARREAMYSEAIRLDPAYAAAYLNRVSVRMSKFFESQDLSEENLKGIREDLAIVRRLVGDSPPLLLAEARYARFVNSDPDTAWRYVRTAQALNPNGVGVLLASAGRDSGLSLDARVAVIDRVAKLDPANPASVPMYLLWCAHRPRDALRSARQFNERHGYKISTGPPLFAFTGSTVGSKHDFDLMKDSIDADDRLVYLFIRLLYEQRLAEARALVESSELTTVRQNYFSGDTLPALGRKPVAELRGWARLLTGDRAAAMRDGAEVLEFVRQQQPRPWNAWYLRILGAEGALFSGNKGQAIADTRAALAMTQPKAYIGNFRYSRWMSAQILAWSGAESEAIDLLEELSTKDPGLGPAEITRQPAFSIALSKNPRYKALERRLEAEIAANQDLLIGAF